MLLITQGAASQQLNRFWSEVQTALTDAHALVIDEGQQEGHPESVTVTRPQATYRRWRYGVRPIDVVAMQGPPGKHCFLTSFLPSVLSPFLPFLLPSCVPSFLSFFLPSIVPGFFLSCLPCFLTSFLPPFLHSFLSSFIPSSCCVLFFDPNLIIF